jgi:phosphoenolpyruvate carboxykinase (GTP)
MPGWKVWTVGEDIAWLHPGSDGRLRAINPEAGFFGVVPGTNKKTNKNAYEMIHHDTIYTNVAVTADGQPWWEGLTEGAPAYDWQGRAYDRVNGPAAHPNARFTVSARQNPSYSTRTEDPRRADLGDPVWRTPPRGRTACVRGLRLAARVLVGAGMASETTAAAVGQVGIVRRDPMAMKPFCGYNFADYWSHWLSFEARLTQPPKVFHVNWFRQDRDGKFLWPGYGDNLRVLSWIIDRCSQRVPAAETPIGFVPRPSDLNLNGLTLDHATVAQLLNVDRAAWHGEIDDVGRYSTSSAEEFPTSFGTSSAGSSARSLSGRGIRSESSDGPRAGRESSRRLEPLILEPIVNRVLCVRLRQSPQADHAAAFQGHRVTPRKRLAAFLRRDERTVRALVDQHETIALDLDARVNA